MRIRSTGDGDHGQGGMLLAGAGPPPRTEQAKQGHRPCAHQPTTPPPHLRRDPQALHRVQHVRHAVRVGADGGEAGKVELPGVGRGHRLRCQLLALRHGG